ncbi:hypothetical protein DK28_0213735 [Peptococcaceae bacterium SCADC1_2_3]|nr:hypothetical protein DK28_0213735 [Peptococcaceae bacterium SCADC1_2_3]KFI35366.1 hypothetical protein HY00_05465 [Peptococcaceae bacterium SCADC1_2_3]
MSETHDYIFSYSLEPKDVTKHPTPDFPDEIIKVLFKSLLNLIIPCVGDKEVKVDGFKFLKNSQMIHKLFASTKKNALSPEENDGQKIKTALLYEPRIALIKEWLENILALTELEKDGEVVAVDGFRLKQLEHWTVPSACDPTEVFEHLATHCNCNCIFCYNKGNHPQLALKSLPLSAKEELAALKTRIKYFNPRAKRSLFLNLGSCGEVLCHPYILEVLTLLRSKTNQVFRLNTNGATLTSTMISALAQFKPVFLDISLNSASPARRAKLMQDKYPQVAIESLPLLKAMEIPYAIVIVPWPLDSEEEMLADLEKTILYAEQHAAHHIQISLPGYTKYFSAREIFNRETIWARVVKQVRELRTDLSCPLVIMPGMYEENFYPVIKNQPEVIGVVQNSPVALGGLKMKDIIRGINGISVHNRPQARELLSFIHQSEIKTVNLTVERNKGITEIKLDLDRYAYPYYEYTDTHLGIIFLGTGFRTGYLEKLREIVKLHQAKEVLLFTSSLVKPTLEQCLKDSSFFGTGEFNLTLEVPANKFFGGNIFMGDLLVVEDFIYGIKQYLNNKNNRKPDLVIIPSSPFNLSQWGRDLTGRVYLDIERETGVPVEILACQTIYD